MFNKLLLIIRIIFLNKEEMIMLALLWAQAIINERPGYNYARVPRLLKEQVRQILIDSGFEELVTE